MMIPFSLELFKTGKFRVVTRSGEPVFIIYIVGPKKNGGYARIDNDCWIKANIPTVKDCRNNTRYGFTRDGKVKATGDDPLDLMLVRGESDDVNRAHNHNSNPPKPTRDEYDGVTYIFHSPIFGGYRSIKSKLLFDSMSMSINGFYQEELTDEEIKRRYKRLYDIDDMVDAAGYAMMSWYHQEHWEEELMESIEVNRNKFQTWLDWRCRLSSFRIDLGTGLNIVSLDIKRVTDYVNKVVSR